MQIREYHRRHPAARVVDAGEEYEQMFKEDPILDFSGEVFHLSLLCIYEAFLIIIVGHFNFPVHDVRELLNLYAFFVFPP